MTKTEIKVGTKVMKSGYKGTVTRVCEWDTDLVEVRLESGTVCVDKATFDGRYANCYVIE
jgi:preprotein translocase subunit YajC